MVQTKKAESSLDSLKQLSAPNAKVIRDNQKITISVRELVDGDIVILRSWRLYTCRWKNYRITNFKSSEGMLTGESQNQY